MFTKTYKQKKKNAGGNKFEFFWLDIQIYVYKQNLIINYSAKLLLAPVDYGMD